MSSRIAPLTASSIPTLASSNFGHSTPGVSSSSSSLPILTHCSALVTPGRSPVTAARRCARELISVDLPTLGIPTTIARIARGRIPLRFIRSSLSFISSLAALVIRFSSGSFKRSSASTFTCSFCRCSTQRRVASGCALSRLVSRISRGFCFVSCSISGFLLAFGMRASRSSITMSTSLRCSSICRFAFVMWPGNH